MLMSKEEERETTPLARRALFGLAIGALASAVLPSKSAEAAVVLVRRRYPAVVVVRPRRRRFIIVH